MPGKKPHALPWLFLSFAVMTLDQFSKALVLGRLQVGVSHPVMPGLLSWTLTFNPGAAFSFLAQCGGWQRWLFVLVALVISLILGARLAYIARHDWRSALPFALIIGGAMGNMIDRLHATGVTDFIDVYYRRWHYPVFNVADCAITVGAALLVVCGLFGSGKRT